MRSIDKIEEEELRPIGPRVNDVEKPPKKGFRPIPGRPGWLIDEQGRMARDPSQDSTRKPFVGLPLGRSPL